MLTQAAEANSALDQGERRLSMKDLAEREGIALQTLRAWRVQGYGPKAMKIGKFVRYRLADVIAWEDSLIEED